uniref:Uncharacterized protein n=1 Tax=Arundo donax TaxID=35708 RepID=A0A0A9E8N1_ARUDO
MGTMIHKCDTDTRDAKSVFSLSKRSFYDMERCTVVYICPIEFDT